MAYGQLGGSVYGGPIAAMAMAAQAGVDWWTGEPAPAAPAGPVMVPATGADPVQQYFDLVEEGKRAREARQAAPAAVPWAPPITVSAAPVPGAPAPMPWAPMVRVTKISGEKWKLPPAAMAGIALAGVLLVGLLLMGTTRRRRRRLA